MPNMNEITFTKPDDWHCHLRDGAVLKQTVQDTATRFRRALIMPNLATPITTVELAEQYRERILAACPAGSAFTPLMTLYLTEALTAQTLHAAKETGFIPAVKYYPAGATTRSEYGVRALENVFDQLAVMEEIGLVLCVHGESTAPGDDIFDREKIFIDQTLSVILRRFPKLRVVLEHISTAYAATCVADAPDNVAATITAHHLWLARNALFEGGIRPHVFCRPILKRETDRLALIAAATSGNPKFFLGTDSAPHPRSQKENPCGCAGIYSAPAGIEAYAQCFAAHNALPKLEGFASHFGAQFYGFAPNSETITLIHKPWTLPNQLPFDDDVVIPFLAGDVCEWKIK